LIQKMATEELDRFGEKIIEGLELSDDDLRALLSLESEEELEKLYHVARKVRDHYFGNRVFLNCFIYSPLTVKTSVLLVTITVKKKTTAIA